MRFSASYLKLAKATLETLIVVATLSALVPLWQLFFEREGRRLQAKATILAGYSACASRLSELKGLDPVNGAWGMMDLPDHIMASYCRNIFDYIESEDFEENLGNFGVRKCVSAEGIEGYCF